MDVARGPHGARVDVVDGVVVERVLLVAGEDVGEARRVGEAEDAVSERVLVLVALGSRGRRSRGMEV